MAEKELIVKFSADIKGMQKDMQKMSKDIAKSIDKATSNAENSFSELESEATETANDMEKSFKKVNFNFDKPVNEAIKKLNKFRTKTDKEFDQVENSGESAFTKLGNKIKKIFSKSENAVDKELDQMKNKTEQTTEKMENSFSEMGTKIKAIAGGLAGAFAIGQITAFVDEQAESMKLTDKMTTAFEKQKLSVEDANKVYKDFYGIIGDYDTSVEASQLLVNMTNNTKDMAKWTEIATGVYATFGDALPIEGFIESANETAKVGKVTGTLADALNWAGISEEAFNGKLEKTRNEQERQKLIMDTLNKKYSETAKLHKENSEGLKKYRDAQFDLNKSKESLARNIMPIVAEGMKGIAKLMEGAVEVCKKYGTEIKALGIFVGGLGIALALYSAGLTLATLPTAIMTALTGAFASAMAFLTAPLTLVIGGIALLGAGMYLAYKKSKTFRNAVDELKEKLSKAWAVIKEGAIALKDKLVGAWEELKKACEPLVKALKENLLGAWNELKDAMNGVKGAFDGLKEKFQPVADILGGALKTSIETVGNWIVTLKDKIIELSQNALGKLNDGISKAREHFQTFKDAVSEFWDRLDPLITTIRDNFVSALQNLKEPLKSIKDSFGRIWEVISKNLLPLLKDTLMPIFDKLKTLFKVVAGIIGGALVVAIGLITGIINGIVKAIEGFVTAFSGIIEVVAGVMEFIVGIFTGDGEKIKNAWESIKEGIVNIFSGLWDAIKGFLGGFLDGIKQFFGALFDQMGITAWWEKVKAWFGQKKEDFIGFFTEWKDKITGWFTEKKTTLVDGFTSWWDGITSWFTEKTSGWGEKLDEWKTAITTWFTEKSTTLVDGITTWWDELTNWFTEKKEEWTGNWNTLKEEVGKCWEDPDYLIDKINGWTDGLNGWSEGKIEEMKTQLEEWKDGISTWFTEKKTAFVDGFNEWWENTKTWFTEKKEEFGTKLTEWKDAISTWFTEKKDAFVTGFTEWWDNLTTWFTETKEKIPEKLGEWKDKIGTWFTEKKDTLVTGFGEWWTGVTDWFTETKENFPEKLKEWKDAIGDWFTEKKTTFTDGFKEWINNFGDWSDKDGKEEVKKKGKKVANNVGEGLKEKCKEKGFIKKIGDALLGLLLASLLAVVVGIVSMGFSLVSHIWDGIKWGWNWLKENFPKLWDKLKEWAGKKCIEIKKSIGEKWENIKETVREKVEKLREKAVEGFQNLKKKATEKIEELKKKAKEKWNEIVEDAKKLPSKMGEGIKKAGKGLANGFISVINTAVKWFLKGVNKIIDGVNWLYKKITGGDSNLLKPIDWESYQIPKLAKGTSNWQGGTALVGEAGREIVSDPKLGTFVTPAPMLLPLSKGASVLRNSKTEKLLAGMGIPAFKKGKNEKGILGKAGDWVKGAVSKVKDVVSDVWEYMSNPTKLLEKVFNAIQFDSFTGAKPFLDIVKKLPAKVTSFAKDWLSKLFKDNEEQWEGNDNPLGWSHAKIWAKSALENAGYKSGTKQWKDFMTAYEIVGRYESNYQNSAWNKTDKNAQAGNPSKGWLQFIKTTFDDYNFKGYNKWLNPVHQAMAFINYANKKYGGPLQVPGVKAILNGKKYKPYAKGGLITEPTKALMGEAGVEAVVPLSNASALKPFGDAVVNSMNDKQTKPQQVETEITYEFTIPVIVDGREIAKATATFTKEELAKLEKRENRRNGKR